MKEPACTIVFVNGQGRVLHPTSCLLWPLDCLRHEPAAGLFP